MQAKDFAEQTGPAPEGQSAMMQMDLRPTLVSVVALDSTRELIGEVVHDAEFEAGKPVLIQASFVNENPDVITDHFISMSIRDAGGSETLSQESGESFEHAATFKATSRPTVTLH